MTVAEQYKELLELNARDGWEKAEIGKVTENEVNLYITVTDDRSVYSHICKASDILAERYTETLVLPIIFIIRVWDIGSPLALGANLRRFDSFHSD